MDNMTLRINPDTRDLVFDDTGSFEKVYERDTTIQNVRHALLTWRAEFFADETHGTDYERIFGINENDIDIEEVKEVIREAVFQEPDVERINSMDVEYGKREISVSLSATLVDGETITLEVRA